MLFARATKQSINNEIIYFLEEYPSLVEGIGLENRKGCQSPRGFESLFLLTKRKPYGIKILKVLSCYMIKYLIIFTFLFVIIVTKYISEYIIFSLLHHNLNFF